MEVKYVHISLARLNNEEIVQALEMGLRKNFVDVEVKWVECPDLTKKPFNLAAPGLCGKTAILDFGNESYLNPYPRIEKTYDINKFLQCIDRGSNSFIFGTGISQRPSNGKLGELVVNSAFSTARHINSEYNNKSRVMFINYEQYKCDSETLTDSQLKCNIQGTFFLSEGSRSEQVLQVYAKKYRENVENVGFINLMYNGLRQATAFTDRFVALGGVYISYNHKWMHRPWPYKWEYVPSHSEMYSKYCTVEEPSAVISIMNNKSQISSNFNQTPSNLNFSRCAQMLSHHCGNGRHELYELPTRSGVFLGYFSLADGIYRIDE